VNDYLYRKNCPYFSRSLAVPSFLLFLAYFLKKRRTREQEGKEKRKRKREREREKERKKERKKERGRHSKLFRRKFEKSVSLSQLFKLFQSSPNDFIKAWLELNST